MHVNNVLFPGASFSARDRTRDYNEIIVLEHMLKSAADKEERIRRQ